MLSKAVYADTEGLSAQWIRVRWGWRSSRWAAAVVVRLITIDYSVGFTDMARS